MTSKVGLVCFFDLPSQGGEVFALPRQVSADDVIHALSAVAVDPANASRVQGGDLQDKEVNELVELSVQ